MVSQGYDPFGGMARPGAPSAATRHVPAKTVETATPDTQLAHEQQLRREISESLGRHDLQGAAARYIELAGLSPDAVLSRQQQLDVANQLMASEQYPLAADAYERFLKHYGNYEHIADIYLMLGLLYGRYLHQRSSAEHYLERAIPRLGDPRKVELARNDLQALKDQDEE
jgi:outer membrane protein assembly factor BamD (BamD/ComL family)